MTGAAWLYLHGFASGPASTRARAFQAWGASHDLAIGAPVLVVHGRGDEVVDIARSREFAARKPHVRLVEVDDGHELTSSISRILAEADAFFAAFVRTPTERGSGRP